MKRVTGLGGIFFKAKGPAALYEWYRKHLGIESAPDGQSPFMINFRVKTSTDC